METWTGNKPVLYLQRTKREKKQIVKDGLNNITLQPQYTGSLLSLRVTFPSEFVHLTNEVGQQKKEQQESSYHISLGYIKDYRNNTNNFRTLLDNFVHKYFDGNWDTQITKNFPDVSVGSGSTYNLRGKTEFEKELQHIVKIGTNKDDAHVSLDWLTAESTIL